MGMRTTFPGYYRPNDEQLQELWENCTFILDANVLLNLYRYPKEARDDLIKILRYVSDRLWIPHQAALEYQENRLSVIAEQKERFDRVKELIQKTKDDLNSGLDKLQLKKRHCTIDPEEWLIKINEAFDQFMTNLTAFKKRQPDVFSDDKLRSEIDNVFEGRVGSPLEAQELDSVYKNGEERFKQKQPPCYKNENVNGVYCHGDLVFKRRFGDLILWEEIIKEARSRQLKYIIFVTDDRKADWWWIVESMGKKTIGPRPELVHEICSRAGVSIFYMYNPERFMQFAKQYLKLDVKEESIRDIKDIGEVATIIPKSVGFLGLEFQEKIQSLAEQAVYKFLQIIHRDSDILRTATGHPDFLVLDRDGEIKIGYEVKFLGSIPRPELLLDYKYYQFLKGDLDKICIFFVVVDEETLRILKDVLMHLKVERPRDLSFIIGLLGEDLTDPSFADFIII